MASQLFSESEVRRLLAQDAGQYLELRSVWDRSGPAPKPIDRNKVRDAIAEIVAAFANADGGTLVLGVEEDGTPTGHAYSDKAVADFFAVPERRLRPAVCVATQRLELDGAELLVIQVPPHGEAVTLGGRGSPVRVADQVLRGPHEVINGRKAAYHRAGFERQTRPEASLEDLDLRLAAGFLSPSAIAGRGVVEVLVAYGLVIPRGGGFAVTNAALLLFGRPPFPRWHPQAGVRLFRVRGTERRPGRDRNVERLGRIDPPLARAIPTTRAAIAAQVRRSVQLHDLFLREMPEYPDFAWQAGLINALAHRDYADQGLEVEVWLFDDRMEIQNPGALLPPVTLDALRARSRVHASRNPLLARVLVDAGMTSEGDEGIPRIHEEMEESFLRPPEFEVAGGTFTLVLRNTPVFEGPGDAWLAVIGGLPVSPNQKRVLLAHPAGFTNKDYQVMTGLDRDPAEREIAVLVDAGIVRSAGRSGRGARYRVSPNLWDSERWLERRLPTLRIAFSTSREPGRSRTITCSDYRNLFDLTRIAATRELRRLVELSLLRPAGEERGARFLPGPRFPADGS